jgi:hypothetical protein
MNKHSGTGTNYKIMSLDNKNIDGLKKKIELQSPPYQD